MTVVSREPATSEKKNEKRRRSGEEREKKKRENGGAAAGNRLLRRRTAERDDERIVAGYKLVLLGTKKSRSRICRWNKYGRCEIFGWLVGGWQRVEQRKDRKQKKILYRRFSMKI
ncbi:hypothetical protein E2542_SST27431 [Spatholobus suberectus]|nr:hypothetical protein E2542_SST27431 [Spatholobus suberectus]